MKDGARRDYLRGLERLATPRQPARPATPTNLAAIGIRVKHIQKDPVG
jgi:hypothetical protein